MFKQQAQVALEPLANTMFDTLNQLMPVVGEAMEGLIPIIQGLTETIIPVIQDIMPQLIPLFKILYRYFWRQPRRSASS